MNLKAVLAEYATLMSRIDNLEEQIGIIMLEKKRLSSRVNEIEEEVKNGMMNAGMKRAFIEGWKINVSKSLSTVVEAADELPDCYWKIERKPDLMAIKETIKTGSWVPGARLVENYNVSLKK